MVAVKPEIKTSNRLLQLIARIERLSGAWEQISANGQVFTEESKEKSLQNNTLALLCLDQSSPAPLTHPVCSYFKSRTPLELSLSSFVDPEHLKEIESCRMALSMPFELSEEGIEALFRIIARKERSEEVPFRNYSTAFYSHENQRIFTAVSPFLVPRRYRELLEWASEELYSDETHPLLVIGIFHLLFLQLHPITTANHRVALAITWNLLEDRGYEYISSSSLIVRFLEQSSLYYSTIRHAERSTFGDWSTSSIWLEFFLKAILECALETNTQQNQHLNEALLSDTQRKIIEVIRAHGVLNREKVVSETGINLSTVKYNLSLLAQKGHLVREGGGRSTSYRAA
jgi:Fic family protein